MKSLKILAVVVAMMAATSAYAEGGANPCAMKSNPCAMKPNPCAAKNPCAMQHKKKSHHHNKAANPCAAKNPCAGKM